MRLYKRMLCALVFAIVPFAFTHAQQGFMLTQFMKNQNYFNPASLGLGEKNCASIFYRSQWTGFEGAPEIMGANFSMPRLGKAMGAGLSVFSDNLGKYRKIQIEGDYVYSVDLKDSKLSFGLKVAMLNMSFADNNWLTPDTPSTGDPSIVNSTDNSWSPSFGFGVNYKLNKTNFGFSILNLFEQKNSFQDIQISQKRKYFFTTSSSIVINSYLDLEPNLMLISDLTNYSFGVNLNLVIDDNLITGLSYNNGDSFAILLGYKVLDFLQIYYSYDYGINKVSSFDQSSGSHELTLRYCFALPERVEKSRNNRNVRFL